MVPRGALAPCDAEYALVVGWDLARDRRCGAAPSITTELRSLLTLRVRQGIGW